MNHFFIIMIGCWLLPDIAFSQVKNDHDLVKDGTPVSGMTASQQKAASTPSKDLRPVKATDIPPLMESTLKDEEFESWQSGSIFYDDMSKVYILKRDTVTTYYFDEKGIRLDPVPDTTAVPVR